MSRARFLRMTPLDAPGRRALWMRCEPNTYSALVSRGLATAIELRAGREGDDGRVRLRVGQTLTAEDIENLLDCLYRAREAVAIDTTTRRRAVLVQVHGIPGDSENGCYQVLVQKTDRSDDRNSQGPAVVISGTMVPSSLTRPTWEALKTGVERAFLEWESKFGDKSTK